MEEESKLLNTHYGIIKHFIQELFGFETKIKIAKEQATQHTPPLPIEETHANEASGSMIESLSFEDATQSESCVTGAMMGQMREMDIQEILNDPFIQRAQELFEPRKIEIHPKV